MTTTQESEFGDRYQRMDGQNIEGTHLYGYPGPVNPSLGSPFGEGGTFFHPFYRDTHARGRTGFTKYEPVEIITNTLDKSVAGVSIFLRPQLHMDTRTAEVYRDITNFNIVNLLLDDEEADKFIDCIDSARMPDSLDGELPAPSAAEFYTEPVLPPARNSHGLRASRALREESGLPKAFTSFEMTVRNMVDVIPSSSYVHTGGFWWNGQLSHIAYMPQTLDEVPKLSGHSYLARPLFSRENHGRENAFPSAGGPDGDFAISIQYVQRDGRKGYNSSTFDLWLADRGLL